MPFINSVRSTFGAAGRMDRISRKNGLSSATAGDSAYQIKTDTGVTTDGLYWISNSNINSGAPFQVYCDMNTNGGGWTLLLTSQTPDWTDSSVQLRNQGSPTVASNYSILSYGDYIKRSATGFQIMIGATENSTYTRSDWASNGYIGTVNQNYGFNTTIQNRTDITVNSYLPGKITSLQTDTADTQNLRLGMPYRGAGSNFPSGILTTAYYVSSWWSTLATGTSGYNAAPYSTTLGIPSPQRIWYWVR